MSTWHILRKKSGSSSGSQISTSWNTRACVHQLAFIEIQLSSSSNAKWYDVLPLFATNFGHFRGSLLPKRYGSVPCERYKSATSGSDQYKSSSFFISYSALHVLQQYWDEVNMDHCIKSKVARWLPVNSQHYGHILIWNRWSYKH